MDVEKNQDVQDEITHLENTYEGRRATDAGSVQQGSAKTSWCGRAAAGFPTVFEEVLGSEIEA